MVKFEYQTVSEAVNDLQSRGFKIDFNLEENLEAFESGKYDGEDFEIVEVHRYEGNSDPGDEAVVYAIESKNGVKGILVSGFGMSSGERVRKLLAKLQHLSQTR